MLRYAGPAATAALLATFAVLVAIMPRIAGEFRLSEFTYVAIYFIALLGLNILTGYSGQISLGHGAFMGLGAYTTSVLYTHYDVGTRWSIPVAGVLAGL